jgi:hypothetical protein
MPGLVHGLGLRRLGSCPRSPSMLTCSMTLALRVVTRTGLPKLESWIHYIIQSDVTLKMYLIAVLHLYHFSFLIPGAEIIVRKTIIRTIGRI